MSDGAYDVTDVDQLRAEVQSLRAQLESKEGTVLYDVEVRDDHDGGSVWYSDLDGDLEQKLEDAEKSAAALSLSRKSYNGAARVVKVTREVVQEYSHGITIQEMEEQIKLSNKVIAEIIAEEMAAEPPLGKLSPDDACIFFGISRVDGSEIWPKESPARERTGLYGDTPSEDPRKYWVQAGPHTIIRFEYLEAARACAADYGTVVNTYPGETPSNNKVECPYCHQSKQVVDEESREVACSGCGGIKGNHCSWCRRVCTEADRAVLDAMDGVTIHQFNNGLPCAPYMGVGEIAVCRAELTRRELRSKGGSNE